MEKTLRIPKLVVKEHNFCAGCGHGICEKMLANLFEELGIDDRVICAGAVGCTCNMPSSLGIDWIQSQHGRAAAVAQGMKKVRPDNIVITYQGDGDAGAIGLAETLYAAKRNAGITVFFVNNGVFGMTGGQTAPTALEGWVTTTAQHGTSYDEFGKPLLLAEMVAQFDVGYVARGSIANFKELQKTKKYMKKALQCQMENRGYSFVEILAPCPTNWKLSPAESMDRILNESMQVFKCGELKG